MKKFTYNILNDNQKLISKSIYSEAGNLINFKDNSVNSKIEQKFEYNSENCLVKKIELKDGIEYNRIEIQYNEDNKIINKKLFISSRLYENIITEFLDKGYITKTFNDNILTKRLICEDRLKKDYTLEYFNDDNSSEKQVNKFDLKNNSKKTEIYDEGNNLIVLRIESYNSKWKLISLKEFTHKNVRLSESTYKFKKDLIVYENHINYFNSSIDNEVFYVYDLKGNLIKKEVKSLNGNLLEFHNLKYDSKNRVIEENGLSNRVSNSGFGGSNENNKFHIIHKYEN